MSERHWEPADYEDPEISQAEILEICRQVRSKVAEKRRARQAKEE
jgi:hypothetical protein